MSEYRLLRRGDVIQRGDQPLNDDCETWCELSGWEIGMEYSPNALKPVRRKIQRDNEDELIAEAERNLGRRLSR
jgi:hypothetical protein